MRKKEQNKILELLKILSEAIDEMDRCSESSLLVQLLLDSQDLAQVTGEYIESVCSEGTKTVALLEDYCDALYQASLEVDQGANHIGNRLHKPLELVINSARSELKPDKLEIAFLSYQSSMFDAMESIYLAASADPSCEAYVIPIPYYNKADAHSLGQMHCDNTRYPDYIPITDWQAYDIEARQPDVIFIHNPYDDLNYATSVLPQYYAKRLHTLTEMLCYTPYYIAVPVMGNMFPCSPGCVFSHKVFMPSDKTRNAFIRAFQEAYGNQFGNPAEKFIALGSPKLDAVFNRKTSDYSLPQPWRVLMEKPNGTKKKVVLFNTSINTLIINESTEVYEKKLRFVLETFKERNDIVLWWRPHPLTRTTYASLRADTGSSKYDKIVEEYQKEGWGIYDDTPDLHRAIACTGAYYGDTGSLLELYRVTGKPVMMWDVHTLKRQASYPAESFLRKESELQTENDSFYYENASTGLNDYLNYLSLYGDSDEEKTMALKRVKIARSLYAHPDGTSGQAIYEYVKREIYRSEAGL